MNEIKTLKIFDLDETILRVPGFNSKKYVAQAGYSFDHAYDFYDHPISLSDELHTIQVISPVFEEWREGHEDPATFCALITHRKKQLTDTVIALLEARKMYFDKHFFLGRIHRKIDSTQEMLDQLPNIEEIRVFEDSIDQLAEYQTYFNTLNSKRKWSGLKEYDIKLYIVDKSKMFRIQDFTISDERRIKLL